MLQLKRTTESPMPTRRVIVSTRIRTNHPNPGNYKVVPQGEADFHGFGSCYEEFEGGPGNYTVAIIEWPDGKVDTVPADMIQFLDRAEPRIDKVGSVSLSYFCTCLYDDDAPEPEGPVLFPNHPAKGTEFLLPSSGNREVWRVVQVDNDEFTICARKVR